MQARNILKFKCSHSFYIFLQKGKDFGYFPKDAVKVEQVLIAEEVEVLTKVKKNQQIFQCSSQQLKS